MTEESARFELAQESYREVLDATKHQDDKIGRFLAAIAFLTGGALVFFDRDVLNVRYTIGGNDLPLAAWALSAFLILVALSVLMLILSLATPLTLPVSHSKHELHRSHIFFLNIAGESEGSWKGMWSAENEASLRNNVETEYITETRNIAVRADHKYARTREGATLFVGAMVFFALAVLFSVDSILTAPATPRSTALTASASVGREHQPEVGSLPWTQARRTVVAVTLAEFSALMLYYQFRAGQKLSEMVERRTSKPRDLWHRVGILLEEMAASGFVVLLWPIFVLSTVLGNGERPWVWSGAPVALITGGVAVGLTVRRLRSKGAGQVAGPLVSVLGGILVLAAVAAIASVRADHQLAVGVAAVLLTLTPNLLDATATMTQRLAAHKNATPPSVVGSR